jgi:PAS domain S-box-containing protein
VSAEPGVGDETSSVGSGAGLAALHGAVLAALGAGVVVHDRQGRIVEVNGAASRILGLSVDELCGRTSMDPGWAAVHRNGSPFVGESHPSMVCLATGQSVRDVVMGVHKPDGSLSWILINAEPILGGEADSSPAAVTAFTEITAFQVALDAAARGSRPQ